MNKDQIKTAAAWIEDLERTEQILSDIRKGSAFVLQCNGSTVTLDKGRCEPVFRALENYLTGANAVLRQRLGDVDDVEDPFDAEIEKMEMEARPRGM